MSDAPAPSLSVSDLFAERAARRQREREAEEQLQRKQAEELAAFKQRLDDFEVTEARVQALQERIRRAFDRGETELMLTSFPSSFCTDNGRAVNNAGLPPINRPDDAEGAAKPREPEWLATMPKGTRPVYEYWEKHLKPGGFSLGARVLSFPGGVPGDIGLVLSWPKSAAEGQL
ncbi:MAG: hypothetical protein J0I21_05880 [Alphaproteobacteria bacterium]|nr:hypothetical protein [Alphaproteobacteria bacterium]